MYFNSISRTPEIMSPADQINMHNWNRQDPSFIILNILFSEQHPYLCVAPSQSSIRIHIMGNTLNIPPLPS